MKTLLAISALCLLALTAHAQAVNVRIISNDGSIQATNSVSLSASNVAGLLSKWTKDSASKGTNAITFNAFVFQELSDKASEWLLEAGINAIKSAGVTNSIPSRAALLWFIFSSAQQTNVVNYLNSAQ